MEEIFQSALDATPAEREAMLTRECAGDPALLEAVHRLLRHHVEADNDAFWQGSAIELEVGRPDAALGERIGPYRLEALIGSGGMGRVYRAVRCDDVFDKAVAIKRIKRGMDADEIIARFRTERQILARLEHPNIARLLDGGTDAQGLPYLVMEFVDGLPLTAYIDEYKPSLEARVRLFREICDAVQYAHQRMVIHRDLKPNNILISSDGHAKLLDFGISKLLDSNAIAATVVGERVLTPRYGSPEQQRGDLVTTATDVYSLGVILQDMLTANELRGDLQKIVQLALSEDPATRYATVAQFSDDLGRYLNGLPVVARGHSIGYVAKRFIQRHKVVASAVLLVIASLIGGIVSTRRAQAQAERRFEDVRAIAHSLVFDYFDALRGAPNSTGIRIMMMKDALTYLDRLSIEAGKDHRLQRDLVAAYVKIARVQGDPAHANEGNASGAIPIVEKAIQLGEALVREDPRGGHLEVLADAYKTRGNLMEARGDLAGADEQWRKSVALLEQVLKIRPTDQQLALGVSEVYWNLGDLYTQPGSANLGRSAEGFQLYERSLSVSRQALAAKPDDAFARRRVYWVLDSLSILEMALGRREPARAHATEALQRMQKEADLSPGNAQSASNLSLGHDHLGRLLLAEGQNAEAMAQLNAAGDLAQAALVTDPKDASFLRKCSIIECYLALAHSGRNDARTALRFANSALARTRSLLEVDASNTAVQSIVAVAQRRRAEAELDLGQTAAAAQDARESASILARLNLKTPNSFFALSEARALLVAGDAEFSLQHYATALEAVAKAESLMADVYQKDTAVLMHRAELARCEARKSSLLAKLGRSAEARHWRERATGHWGGREDQHFLLFQDPHEPERTDAYLAAAIP